MTGPAPLLSAYYLQIIGFLVSLISCALFSFLETSLTALRLFKLKELEKSIKQYKALFHALENDPHRILITILIASSLSNVTAAALITQLMERLFVRLHFSSGIGFSFGIGAATSAILIFGEVIPKNFARSYGNRFLTSTLWITNITFYLLYPFVTILTRLSNFFLYRFQPKHALETSELVTSEKELQFLIDYIDEKGLMETDKTAMLRSIFTLGKKPVREIMVPETDIISINVSINLEQALDLFCRHQFSRLPAYEGDTDNIIGLIHQKDIFLLLSKSKDRPLSDVVRPILFTPETMKVNQLMKEMQEKQMHMAIVLNEFGSVTGLVTLEDAIEEIVGEIKDEYEPEIEKITLLQDGGWLIDATTDLSELKNLLQITFEAEDVLTLGGFLTEQLQHLPQKGERLLYKNYYFQVQKATPKRVIQVLVFRQKD